MTHVIITPGKKWIPAASVVSETDTHGDATVTGFYQRLSTGIRFFDLEGVLFAFLVTNRRGESFFVTATDRSSGQWYMHSTCSITEAKLGIQGMGYLAKKELEQRIVDDLDTAHANQVMEKHGVNFGQFVGMANGEPTPDDTRHVFFKAGLTVAPHGIEDDGYLLAGRTGRQMLSAAGFAYVNGKWLKTAPAIAA
ncbi:hypothetical protein [Pseudomonas mosselii]|uniref:hypothetical protein n=1 Tax=Pseudomonas mosselii TaxID=78327 RepID=UPI0021D8463C|nr:hypothetical protein [Pseudomonas mosselii]MCU9529351.1 hypothetical protein [Pseudomonas mosselii]MCU9536642.1 hypothetical protein [Pseudomonas mosselii]MCU9542262.1 hypothetical protein [Pseudomonas mosselii]MCU9548367.1 hypothetical protein [Pseudomonas mosselii]